jgi:F0F1-type ATP synthase delta subunit
MPGGKYEMRRVIFQGSLSKKKKGDLMSKITRTKSTGVVTPVVECVLSNCRELSSKPQYPQYKKKISIEPK